MNIAKYFWGINNKALKKIAIILKTPDHPQFPAKMVTFLSRCDRPAVLFSLISENAFVDTWPKIRTYWIKRARKSDFRDWWETLYEQLAEKQKLKYKKPSGAQPVVFKKFGALIKESRLEKGLSQKQLAMRLGMKQPDVSRVEEGRKNITLYTIMRFCKILGIKKIDIML